MAKKEDKKTSHSMMHSKLLQETEKKVWERCNNEFRGRC